MKMKPINMMRVWLRPWWAKFVAVVVVMAVCVGWYATWIYVGYQNDRNAIDGLKLESYFGSENVLPGWIVEYFPQLEIYGFRTTSLSIDSSQKVDVKLFLALPYLEELSFYEPEKGIPDSALVSDIIDHAQLVKVLNLAEETNNFGASGIAMTQAIARSIARHANIKDLSVYIEGRESEYLAFEALSKSKNIKQIEILIKDAFEGEEKKTKKQLKGVTANHLNPLSNMKSLKRLKVLMNGVKLEDVTAMNKITSLEHLHLEVSFVTQSDINQIANIKHLRYLDIDNDYSHKPSERISLSPLKKLNKMRYLIIATRQHEGLAEAVSSMPSLISLMVIHGYRDNDYSYVKALTHSELKSLIISDPNSKTMSEQTVEDLYALKHLVALNISNLPVKIADQINQGFITNAKLKYPSSKIFPTKGDVDMSVDLGDTDFGEDPYFPFPF